MWRYWVRSLHKLALCLHRYSTIGVPLTRYIAVQAFVGVNAVFGQSYLFSLFSGTK